MRILMQSHWRTVRMLRMIACFFHILCFGLPSFQTVSGEPSPPFKESPLGYLTADAEIAVPAPQKKLFIVPQARLRLLNQTDKAVEALAIVNSYGILCEIPKYVKFLKIMELSEDGKTIFFRGGLEAKTVPIRIDSGSELPIEETTKTSWIVKCREDETEFLLAVPRDTEGISFSEMSRFAKFAESQKAKGLVKYKDSWLPAKEAEKKIALETNEEEKNARLFETLKTAADRGRIILADGTALKGTKKGSDSEKIYFSSNGRDFSLSPHDIMDISPGEMFAESLILDSIELLSDGLAKEDANPAEAALSYSNAKKIALDIRPASPEQSGRVGKLLQKIDLESKKLEQKLSSEGFTIYDYSIQPTDALKRHLEAGDILLKRLYWVSPDQICKRCSGTGLAPCPECGASGKIIKPCPHCKDGKIPCKICGGSGEKKCWICKGSGILWKRCPTCGGSGSVVDYSITSYPWSFSSQVVVSNRTPVVYMNYQPCWSYWGGTTTSRCPVCNGSGQIEIDCWNCNGTGLVPCPKTQDCEFCKGKAFIVERCPTCRGRRQITCPDCAGKGFSGDVKKDTEDRPAGGGFSNSPVSVPVF